MEIRLAFTHFLTGKEHKLVEEAKRYSLHIVWTFSTKSMAPELFSWLMGGNFSTLAPMQQSLPRQVCRILICPRLADCVDEIDSFRSVLLNPWAATQKWVAIWLVWVAVAN